MSNYNNHNNPIEDELRDIAPFLSKISKKENFQVPESYFDHFPYIATEEARREASGGFAQWWAILQENFKKLTYVPAFGMLTALLLVFVLFSGRDSNLNFNTSSRTVASTTMVEQDNALLELIADDAPTVQNRVPKQNHDSLENYIMDHVDVSTITEEL